MPLVFDGETLDRCPRRPFLDDPEWFDSIFTSYSWVQKGFLPVQGTYHDIPNKLATCFKVIDQAIHYAEDEDKKTQARRARQGPPAPPQMAKGPPRTVRR